MTAEREQRLRPDQIEQNKSLTSDGHASELMESGKLFELTSKKEILEAAVPSIYFASQFPPIMCGIADYTRHLTEESQIAKWRVISFNPESFGHELQPEVTLAPADQVLYSIPKYDYSASMFLDAIERLNHTGENYVLWFQHEFGTWRDSSSFVDTLKELDTKKIVTLHSLNFQSNETEYGLEEAQYNLLRDLLPHVNAITVFSDGVYDAVARAFPTYQDKVAVIRHGTPLHPETNHKEAKRRLFEFLIYESDLDQEKKKKLDEKSDVLFDENTEIIGEIGFVAPYKNSEIVYFTRDQLQKRLPDKRILAIIIGSLQVLDLQWYKDYFKKLENLSDDENNFFIPVYLPKELLPIGLKALGVNVSWPRSCSQSGRLAHAQGAGAVFACKDLEGVGETSRMSGGISARTLEDLLLNVEEVITTPGLKEELGDGAREYAKRFHWRNQALKHYELANAVVHDQPLPSLDKGLSRVS